MGASTRRWKFLQKYRRYRTLAMEIIHALFSNCKFRLTEKKLGPWYVEQRNIEAVYTHKMPNHINHNVFPYYFSFKGQSSLVCSWFYSVSRFQELFFGDIKCIYVAWIRTHCGRSWNRQENRTIYYDRFSLSRKNVYKKGISKNMIKNCSKEELTSLLVSSTLCTATGAASLLPTGPWAFKSRWSIRRRSQTQDESEKSTPLWTLWKCWQGQVFIENQNSMQIFLIDKDCWVHFEWQGSVSGWHL